MEMLGCGSRNPFSFCLTAALITVFFPNYEPITELDTVRAFSLHDSIFPPVATRGTAAKYHILNKSAGVTGGDQNGA